MSLRFLSGINVDSNTLFVDSTNNRVGIGTGSPTYTLDVVGSIRSTGNEGKVIINSTAVSGKQYEFISIDTGNLGLYDGTSYRLWVSGAGNVGIGTTAPAYTLDVNGNIRSLGGIRNEASHSTTNYENILPAVNNGGGTGIAQMAWWVSEPNITWEWGGFGYNVINDGGAPYGFSRRNTSFGQAYMRMSTLGDWYFYNTNTSGTRVTTMTLTNAGNVGIGTTAPAEKLEVVGNIQTTVSGGDAIVWAKNGTVQSYLVANTTGGSYGLVGTATNHDFLLRTNNTEKMRITSAGNVGIGTTAPEQKLHVEGSGLITTFKNSSAGTNEYTQIEFAAGNRRGYIWLGNENTSSWAGAGGLNIYTANGDMDLWTGGSQRVRITNGGNVGIGNTNPGYKLEVSGTSYFSGLAHFGQTATSGSAFRWGSYGTAVSADTMLCMNQLWNGSGWTILNSGVGTTYLNLGGDVASPTIQFGTGPANTAATTKMIILNNGDVGIGTTSPGYKLDVSNAARVYGVRIGRDFSIANRATVRLDSNGDAPADILFGQTAAANQTSWDGVYWSISSRNSGAGAAEGNKFTIWRGSAHGSPNNSENQFVTITPDLNFGIGTASPSNKLTVYQGGGVRVTGITSGDWIEMSGDLPGYSANQYPVIKSNGTIHFANNNKYSAFLEGANTYFGILDNTATTRVFLATSGNTYFTGGNVGIGTTAPEKLLHISGGSGNVDNLILESAYVSAGVGVAMQFNRSSGVLARIRGIEEGAWNGGLLFEVRSGNTYPGYNGATDVAMKIATNGNVGIGTTAPTARLTIGANTSVQSTNGIALGVGETSLEFVHATFQNGFGSKLYSVDSGNGITSLRIATRPNSTSWSDAVTIIAGTSGNGNVGIGTTSPSYKLDVSGSARVNSTSNLAMFVKTNSAFGAAISYEDSTTGGNDVVHAGAIGSNFYIATGYSEQMRVSSSGNVIIGSTTDAGYKLDVHGEILGRDDIRILNTFALILNGTDANWRIGRNTITDSGWLTGNTMQMVVFGGQTGQGFQVVNTNGTALFEIDGVAGASRFTNALGVGVNPSGTAGRIDASNDIVAYSTSDQRLKENITPIANALDKVKALTGVEFDWKEETKAVHGYEGHDVGVIAQEVQAVLPEAVRTNDSGYLSVRYEKMIALLVEANKELASRVEELEKKLK